MLQLFLPFFPLKGSGFKPFIAFILKANHLVFNTALSEINSINEEKLDVMPLNKKGVVPNKESKRGKFINGKFHRKQTNKSAAEKRIIS